MTVDRRSPDDPLGAVFAAWRLSARLHRLRAPADDRAIADAEAQLGRPIHSVLARLYRFSDGFEALEGNLKLEPLLEAGSGLVGLGDDLRSSGWRIPREVLVFGGNGAGDQFGLWYPAGASPDAPAPVVIVGAVFLDASLALAGTDLPRFLVGWSAYYLLVLDAPSSALDALGLPDALRSDADQRGIAPYISWADPSLADPDPDPYERGTDAPVSPRW